MKKQAVQTIFGGEFAVPIEPDANIREPLLWFQSLHLLRLLGAGAEKDVLIRKFTFRPGLNILWAEPEDPESDSGLYGDGFAGHSTGKTIFCRILRYLLGEPNFGTSELMKRIGEDFKNLWAVASIRLDSKTWLVGRSLAGVPAASFAIEDGNIDDVLKAAPIFGNFEIFLAQLEKVCGAPIASMYPKEGWRNLLPWLARDQEARLAGITAWRDSSSDADNPRNTVAAQHLILRAVLRLLETEEFNIREEMSRKDDESKRLEGELPLKRVLAERDLRQFKRTVKSIPNISIDTQDLISAKKHIAHERQIRQEALEDLRKQPDSKEVVDARRQLQEANNAKAAADDRIRRLTNDISEENERAEKLLLTIDRGQKTGFVDPARVESGFCPHTYGTACKRGCVRLPPGEIDPSMVQISELVDKANALKKAVDVKRTQKATLESQQGQLEAAIRTKKKALEDAVSNYPSLYAITQTTIALLSNAQAEVEDAINSAAEAKSYEQQSLSAKKEIEVLRGKLNRLKLIAEQNLRGFSNTFGEIVNAVLGRSVVAHAELGERGINLHVKRNNRELGGAAIESVKTIAFDLAAVLHSVRGRCDHPRFLIHDGPREADMARVTYEHFFLWARRMEEAFPKGEPSFQYIITTTTQPPENMREGSKWLLDVKLSGKTKEGRLLKEDF